MSNDIAVRHLPVLVTILVAFMLKLMPLPTAAEPFRPDWIVLILIFWAMTVPRSYSIGIAWMIGIVLETLQREHEQHDKAHGEGIAGEVDHIDQRTRQMDQRLERIESMLEALHRRDGGGSKPD